MKTFQDFSPYNGLQWEPNGSRSKRQFQYKLQSKTLISLRLKKERHGHLGWHGGE